MNITRYLRYATAASDL